jgi:U3 small nucleolar RNA-associated protein 12
MSIVVAEKLNTMDFYGHPTGIRSIAISSDDRLACTVSKNVTKIWNVASRTCIQSLTPAVGSKAKKKAGSSSYGLCTAFLPGNTHVAVGTREGHLMLLDVSSGEVVYVEEGAHEGAIWSLDIRRPSTTDSSVAVVTGSADKSVKFWSIESQDGDEDDDAQAGQPMFVHTRTLQMTDDVISVKYSHSQDPTKRLVFVSTLDCTIKVFFDDSLKMFLSLYGHKLPALSVDCSDDDVLLASAGADKTVKIWGLDFGDTHRTMHGHGDSITDLRFVRRTHNFFTASKDGTVRYWDGDRFEQILLLHGHCAEVNCLAISRSGAFVLSGGMDRQVRVWERTKDIVFLEEERERELEQIFDRVHNRDEGGTARILDRKRGDEDHEDENGVKDDEPQSEAAVRASVLSVSSGDRIMEALERADQELKDTVTFRRAHGNEKKRAPNLMMLGLEPAAYILWVLRTIKSADVEQSLIVLSVRHIERLMYYMLVLLKGGQGVELCSRVAVFLVKAHQNQVRVRNDLSIQPLFAMKISFYLSDNQY